MPLVDRIPAMKKRRQHKMIAAVVSMAILIAQVCGAICVVSACDTAVSNAASAGTAKPRVAESNPSGHCHQHQSASGHSPSADSSPAHSSGPSSTTSAPALPQPESDSHNCPSHDTGWLTSVYSSGSVSANLLTQAIIIESFQSLIALNAPPRIAARWSPFHSPPRIPQRSILRI